MATWLGWFGFVFGVTGAFLLATNSKLSRWGWVAFLFSNVAWIIFSIASGLTSLLLQNLVFTATSLLGLKRWFLTHPGH